MQNLFKENVRQQLIAAAKEYLTLVGKIILLKSDSFIYEKSYCLMFNRTNFLHLTGVATSLKPDVFFNRCLETSISTDGFDYNKVKNKTNIRNKLRCLITLTSFFEKELLVQEHFVKNRVICKIATSDGLFTIGFIGGKRFVYPKTVLNKYHLDSTMPIIRLIPIIK